MINHRLGEHRQVSETVREGHLGSIDSRKLHYTQGCGRGVRLEGQSDA